MNTASSQNGDSDETSAEQDIQNQSEKGEEGDTSEEAGQDNRKSCINDSDTRDALNSFFPFWDGMIPSLSGEV